ncbi:RagB/SusD family nutrient uptake outer membrane protein [Pustulibacterium marinum]|nr:RagB/SusD family nutrient uptake outer membrane protein [Pustulibacterium marinum]
MVYLLGGLLLFLGSCSDFIEVEIPSTELSASQVFDSDESALLAATGMYITMMDNLGYFANKNTTLFAGLSADEFVNLSNDGAQAALYENNLLPSNAYVANQWSDMYKTIYQANALLAGLETSEMVSQELKDQLIGEGYFMRGFAHWYLTRFFGEVPYITGVNYELNSTVSRMPVAEVYTHLISDLEQAVALLPEDYSLSSGERIRPNRYAAQALLARVYLYQEDWQTAYDTAGEIIGADSLYELVDIGDVFHPNNSEAIWQLYPVIEGFNTIEGYSFTCCVTSNFSLSASLVAAFESGDTRFSTWVASMVLGGETYYYPYKYQVSFSPAVEEYYTVFRLAEIYLIQAEAAAHLSMNAEAVALLNAIRGRAGLEALDLVSSEDILDAVMQERRVELFAEWGHRWFDLQRSGNTTPLESKADLQETDFWYPIPESERLLNPNLTQNDGY